MSTPAPWHIVVLIPARNEEVLLPRCLHSVQAARLRLPQDVTSDVVVISDCSDDATREVAEKILGESGIVLSTDVGVVGSARAIAVEAALKRFNGSKRCCWLANTDADCEVPNDWLLNQLAAADAGYEAVAGIVDIDSFADHKPIVRDLFRLTYTIHSDGTHPHVHGANLGVRADTYLRAGGWRALATGEEHDLWERLRRGGYQRLSDAKLQVITSGRPIGRAPSGFADALAAHNGTAA